MVALRFHCDFRNRIALSSHKISVDSLLLLMLTSDSNRNGAATGREKFLSPSENESTEKKHKNAELLFPARVLGWGKEKRCYFRSQAVVIGVLSVIACGC